MGRVLKGIALCLSLLVVWSMPVLAAKKETITYLGRGDVREQQLYRQLLDAFEAQNPDIDVEVVWVPGGAKEIFEKLLVMIAGGTPPDVFWVHLYNVADLGARNVLLNLDDLVKQDETFRSDAYYRVALDAFTYGGNLVGLPREISAVVMYYNKDLFDRGGVAYPDDSWTWDDLLQNAKKLSTGTGPSRVYGVHITTDPFSGFDLPIVWQNGGSLFNEERTKSTLDKPETIEAYQWMADLIYKHQVAPRPMDLVAAGVQLFPAGRIAMAYGIRADGGLHLRDAAFEWDVTHLPRGKVRATRVSASGHAIYAGTKHKEASWRLLKFLAGEEAARLFVGSGLVIPPIKSVAESPAFVNPDSPPQSDRVFLEALAYGRPDPVTRNYFEVLNIKGAALDLVWTGEKSAEEALKPIVRQIDAALSK